MKKTKNIDDSSRTSQFCPIKCYLAVNLHKRGKYEMRRLFSLTEFTGTLDYKII